ncbi:holin [Paenibacillus sp. BIHB 4019]|uniref:Holin n=1 Tax=Paenibacillus sp. BIHB 4019 TaxID=1870819 RepID=A0A1B2DEW5_9BACL|nr:phage holin family protein [Paenibacillus sp. BIHB 4019]ANY66262.1 holin [Paenibacillus sp. BIHB 4019]
MNKGQALITTAGAFVVPIFEYLYGAGDAVLTAMMALLFFVAMDWISGIRAAKKDFSYASKYGIDGVFRTFFMLALPAGGHLLDLLFNLPGLFFGALTAGLLYHVIQSMVANALRAGWGAWLPLNVFESLLSWVSSELDKKINRAAERGAIANVTDNPENETQRE